ncbi:MAG: DUF2490 domain-containing protein [Bryobacteraceae bacterium]|nr:DUF2490 domain-containing protein [Bryobacteraceae bacterium]
MEARVIFMRGSARFTISLIIGASAVNAENERGYEESKNIWFSYFGDHSFARRWDLHVEGQWRQHSGLSQPQQLLLRSGLNYHVSKAVQVSGYCTYLRGSRYGTMPSNLGATSEHRRLEQIIVNHRVRKLALQHRASFESLWISVLALRSGDAMRVGWQYRNRYRQWLRVTWPIGDGRRYRVCYDEIWLNVAPVVAPNLFDQDRAYGRLGWRFGEHERFEVGSMYQLQPHRKNPIRKSNLTFSLNLYSKPAAEALT